MKARIAFRALIAAGLLLAWLGLLLPWERWRAAAGDGSVGGVEASRLFWIVLAPATVLAALALWRHRRSAFVALAAAALVLVGVVVREMGASAAAGSALVSVGPGAGAIVALLGAAALLSGVILALRPPGLQLAAGLAAFAIVTGGAAALPYGDGRPADGEIAEFAGGAGHGMAFQGDTLYRAAGGRLLARPAPARQYDAVRISDERDFDVVFAADTAYVALAGIDRLVSVSPDGARRTLVARPRERGEPAIPEGTAVAEDFVAGPLAAGPDGSVYVLQGDRVVRWRDGRLDRLAPRFRGARAIAADARGALYVADTGNGRVHHVDPDGAVETVVGTDARPDCVAQGLDDPLALDPSRCTAVTAVAVDRAGNLYLALKNAGMIVGLTPEGRMGVVAGTGPKGFGDGEATEARLGVVEALAVGPDGDLYVAESDPVGRVRRIADPAGGLASEPSEPAAAEGAPACAEIAALNVAATGVGDLERALEALTAAAPEEIRDDVDAIASGARDRTAAVLEVRRAMEPDDAGVSLGEHAEEKCGLVGGFDVPVEEANAFCVAYARYRDQGELAEAGEEPPRALEDVVAAAPAFVADAGRYALRQLESAAGRAVPGREAARVLAGIEAVDAVASAMCVAA